MASLKSQLDKATTDLNRAGYVRDQRGITKKRY
jgi:hypothetical protein